MTSVADVIAAELHQAGIDRAFGLPGGEVLHFIEALRKHQIEFVLCRHEADAGIMASVYGKLKRTPGLALTTLGPGAANLMLPLANSRLDREPLLAISAQIPTSWPLAHTHQRIPLVECYRPVTKWADALTRSTARRSVRRAVEICLTEPAGPVYFTLSAEEAVAVCQDESGLGPEELAVRETTTKDPAVRFELVDPEHVANSLRQRLASAERPLILLGLDVAPDLASKLRAWLQAWQLPVAVTPKVKGLVDETEDSFVGVIGGMAIDEVMIGALRSADLLVGFGLDPVEIDKTWHADLPILWILESPLALEVLPDGCLVSGDHQAVLDHLIASEPPRSWVDPFAEFKRRRMDSYRRAMPTGARLQDSPTAIVQTLADVLPDETIVTTDVGSHKYLFGQYWPSRNPETFFMSNGLSGMGYGLPAAIGAKLARPNVPVLAVLGDGGFSMNSQELETARRIGAPVIVVVLADGSYSMIRLSQQGKGLPRYGVDFHPIDTIRTAQACGVDAARAETREQLSKLVGDAAKNNQSMVVEVPVAVAAYEGLI